MSITFQALWIYEYGALGLYLWVIVCQVWNFDKLAINGDYFNFFFFLYEIPL